MRKSIFSKLSKSFVLLSIVIVIFMIVLINNTFNREFESYLYQQNISQIDSVAEEVVSLYKEGGFSEGDLAILSRIANRNKYDIRVLASSGEVMVEVSARNMMHRSHMTGRFRNEPLEYNVSEFQKGEITVEIGYLGTYLFSSQEASFQRNIQMTVIGSGALLLILSLAISYAVSNRLSRPIRAIRGVAEEIELGNFSFRYLGKHSDPLEIYELSESINKMSNKLRDQEKLRGQLSSDMAHEIRTPLSIVQGQVEAMICGVWELDKDNLESIYEELGRMNSMVDKLRDIHMIEASGSSLRRELLDLRAEIQSVTSSLKPIALEKQIEIELDLEGDIEVSADRDVFRQILYNLLINAVKYSKDNSKIRINLYDRGLIVLEVVDEGLGISKEDINAIFERFYRGDKSRNKKTGGLGLGLTIVKALVEAHGWKVEVESEVNVGSVFRVKIPKKD